MMIPQHKTLTLAAIGTLLAALAGGALAADPPGTPAAQGGRRLTREEFVKQSPEQLKRFKENTERAKATQHNFVDRTKPRGPANDITVRIEEYADGAVLYSEPYDLTKEAEILSGGVFRKVKDRNRVSDRTLFQGRLYRVMRVEGDARSWEAAIGRESVVKVQSNGYGAPVGVDLRAKR